MMEHFIMVGRIVEHCIGGLLHRLESRVKCGFYNSNVNHQPNKGLREEARDEPFM